MFKRFIGYYKPHMRIFVADMAAALLVALIGIVYPIITRYMLNDLIPNGAMRTALGLSLLLLFLYGLRMLLNFFIQYYGHVMGVRMQAHMRSDMFAHLEKLPYAFYDDHETGKIMSRMTNDLMNVSELAHHGPENIIISGLSIIISFVYLATINLVLTLIVFALVPILFFVAVLLRGRMDDAFTRSRQAVAEINAALEGSISGVRTTKAFVGAAVEQEKFEVGNRRFCEARGEAYRAMGLFHSSTDFLRGVFDVLVLLAGGYFLYRGGITLGDYSAFVVSVSLFIHPVMTLVFFTEQLQDGITGFRRFVEIMDVAPECDKEDAVPLTVAGGRIEIKNISHTYTTGGEVLSGIDLVLPAGSVTALVGPSGGGKTTVCHLLPRFYTPTGGRILIDGQDVANVTLTSLRAAIGIVQQDVYLFNASIRDNILYGRPDATEEEMVEAAKRANIHDYVLSLEKGYDTEIGERGVRLSGGQKQRLSIARVFLKNPPILILDEATSALDNTTEALIQASLNELCRGRTTLVVAHRLPTVRHADSIAVIEGGRVIEQGSHEALLAADGAYARLARQIEGADAEKN